VGKPFRYKLAAAAGLLLAAGCLESVRLGRPRVWPGAGGPVRPVRILRFFASAMAVAPGGSAMLCYSVENAKSVQIAPLPLRGVYPSSSRCIEVAPEHTTNYTILAVGFDGAVAMRSLTLPVQAKPPAPVVAAPVFRLVLADPPRLTPSSPAQPGAA